MANIPYLHSDEIELVSLIGQGEQCKVWKGKCRGFDVAVKIPIYQALSIDVHELLCEEVAMMRWVNVVLVLGKCIHSDG